MSLFKQFGTDVNKEINGIKIEYPEAVNADGTIPYFVLARMGRNNKAFAAEYERLTRPYRNAIENDRMPKDKAEEILLNVFCKTIVIGWGNIQPEDDGVNLEFNFENVKFILSRPDMIDLFSDLQAKSNKAELYKPEDMELDAKN